MRTITILAATVAAVTAVGQTSPIAVQIDDKPFESAVAPVQVGERVLVPMRGIFEAMGARVDYDQGAGTVVASKGPHTTQLKVGSDKATVDGREITLPTPMRPMNGSVMVPLRFVSESLGATVNYDAAMRRVDIDSPAETDAVTTTENPVTYATDAAVPYTPDASATYATDTAAPATPPVAATTERPERIVRSETVETAPAPGFDFLKILPWVLGLIVLGVAGAALMAARARKGGVIASDDTKK